MTSSPRIGLLCAVVAAVVALFATVGTAAAATGRIEGEVVDSVTELGIEEVEVCAFDAVEICDTTDPDGKYVLGGLPDGHYLVEFWAPYLSYVTQYFNGAVSLDEADEVVVTGGTVSGVDAELEKGGEITGRVTDAATSAGIAGVEVCAESNVFGDCELTDSSGNYTIPPIPSGAYVVGFLAASLGYETRYYNEAAGEGAATLVGVFALSTTTGINAKLSKPGSHVVLPHLPSVPAPVVSVPPVPKSKPKVKPRCKKAFKPVKRHGHTVCVKKHKKKKHRS